MRKNYNYIKGGLITVIVLCLYGFSNQRNSKRLVTDFEINFKGENKLFITKNAVSKLLIQNQTPITDQSKDIIDLNGLETALNSNPMVKNAEIYMTVNGRVFADIEQRQPIARVHANQSYYIDSQGEAMPLSSSYTAHVPLVTGIVKKDSLDNVFQFAKLVREDDFLKKHVIEIHQNTDYTVDFKIRKSNFKVHLGHLDKLEKKVNNFKIFYQKALKDKLLDSYKLVNLKFDKQVICTKV